MGSFKFKLVLWFALLALLPLAIAFYGYDSLAKRSETRRADAALQAGLRGAVAGYAARLDAAGLAAQQLAAEPKLQRALRGHYQRTIKESLSRVPRARRSGRSSWRCSPRSCCSASRRISLDPRSCARSPVWSTPQTRSRKAGSGGVSTFAVVTSSPS